MKNNNWISVKERLPEKYGDYLITDGSDIIVDFYSNRSFGISPDGDGDPGTPGYFMNITHWQPLPEPPGEDD